MSNDYLSIEAKFFNINTDGDSVFVDDQGNKYAYEDDPCVQEIMGQPVTLQIDPDTKQVIFVEFHYAQN